MKISFSVLGILLIICFVLMSSLVIGQASSQADKPSSDQWVSHQMNQPPPSADKYKVSQDRIDEIRQLYDLAKQEADAKKDPKPDAGK